jgi:hypothetical protein
MSIITIYSAALEIFKLHLPLCVLPLLAFGACRAFRRLSGDEKWFARLLEQSARFFNYYSTNSSVNDLSFSGPFQYPESILR